MSFHELRDVLALTDGNLADADTTGTRRTYCLGRSHERGGFERDSGHEEGR